ncbi:hypothetical protein EHI44_29510 [Rhizobium leguminosarum]|uniref:hypothetical protein n=1 Tax=Rhizobium leguminosarum TaxID=384 RepID=UPI000FF754E6|nr:hypothetical protein [Rhizobium leguminosarum]RWY80464.1 hypothetical protein EHI44_29510 [Rhizobium leguminosarum]
MEINTHTLADYKVEGKHFVIASSAEDLDVFAAPFVTELERRGATTSLSCFWSVQDRLLDGSAVNTLISQYSDNHPLQPDAVAVVSTSILEEATVAVNLDRVASRFPSAHPYVFAPVTSSQLMERLRTEIDVRRLGLPDFRMGAEPDSDLGADYEAALDRYVDDYLGGRHAFHWPDTIDRRPPLPKLGW